MVAFLLAAAFGALLTAGLTFREARSAILQRTQDTAVADLRSQLDSLAPDLVLPPTTQAMRGLTLQLDRAGGSRPWHASAAYRKGEMVSASAAPAVPDGLRREVESSGRATYQRFERGARAWLAVGMPVAYAPDPGREDASQQSPGGLSGLTVYVSFSLDDDQADIDALVTAAQAGAVPALALALLPALYAAARVLRPVRRLQEGAERIASGELATRLDVKGRDELASLTRSFNTMATTLESDDSELRRMEAGARRFASDVAHELRTPLAAMTAVTGVLDEDADSGILPEDTADAVRLISTETRTLARMVDDLMEVSRFEAKAAPLHLENTDLRTLVAKTLQVRGWADDPRVCTELDGPLPVRVDPRRIDVILGNLIGNALRHGRPPVTLAARVRDGHTVVTVTDQGPGIPDDVLPHVFERFYKADRARTRSEGSGLGLAIAHENAFLHGATLTAANAPHGGAVFTLTLTPAPLEQP
ncbi:sensor histidine kinase [Streptomyces sp. NBC_01012]|uniref:sensor histidine kinase n=1 Tax=Streptomyces sp. NBC_01012 TaxID=2903717 RepID=UPI003864DE2B|nr:HAMP domain-containing histidine kinase [Streptomyces sp. NBC_01012]